MLSIAPAILPVTSTRNTTSGFGGISAVVTTLSTSNDEPGSTSLFTEAGETPGSARADPTRAKASAVVVKKRMLRGLDGSSESMWRAHPPCTRAAIKAKRASLVMQNCVASEVCKGNVRAITKVGESSSISDIDSLLLCYG
jgi:hypothetical protein